MGSGQLIGEVVLHPAVLIRRLFDEVDDLRQGRGVVGLEPGDLVPCLDRACCGGTLWASGRAAEAPDGTVAARKGWTDYHVGALAKGAGEWFGVRLCVQGFPSVFLCLTIIIIGH